jgi:hypothetical protein
MNMKEGKQSKKNGKKSSWKIFTKVRSDKANKGKQ